MQASINTKYNKWIQQFPITKSTNNNIINITFYKQQFEHIHGFKHATLCSDIPIITAIKYIKNIKCFFHTKSEKKTLFNFTFNKLLIILKTIGMKITNFFLPFQYLLFNNKIFYTTIDNFLGFSIDIEFNNNFNLSSSYRIDGVCYQFEDCKNISTTNYLINQYTFFNVDTRETSHEIKLNYDLPAKFITIYDYDETSYLCAKLNGIPFYGSSDNKCNFSEFNSSTNVFEYLKYVDKHLFEDAIMYTKHENFMTFKALCENESFFDTHDVSCKLLLKNKTIQIETICMNPIGNVNFVIAFSNILKICEDFVNFEFPIIKNDLSCPFTKLFDNEFVEGYWQDHDGVFNDYPYPYPSNENVNSDFLNSINKVKQYCNVTVCNKQSWCRLCNKQNGCMEYVFKINGNTYRFPEGLIHYYKEHNVKPSELFQCAVKEYIEKCEY